MDLVDDLMLHLENQALQTLLNQALCCLIEQSEGSVTFPLTTLSSEGSDGVIVEVNLEKQTVTLKTADAEQVQAYQESFTEEKH